jgi:hypothetical protein
MDATITYDEVATLIGVNILLLNPRLNFKEIEFSAATLSVNCNASHAPKAPFRGGRAW